MRWQDLAMHLFYIFSDRNAAAALREYQCWNADQQQLNRHVFATIHCSLRVTGTFMKPTHVACSRLSLWDEKKVLDAAYVNLVKLSCYTP
jgi:hypothetical protein